KDGVVQAMSALRRFRALLGPDRPGVIFGVATAAVREAKDGREFVERVRKEAGLELRILTGAEEAQHSALGGAASLPPASGVVADLGGASVELTGLKNGHPGKGKTFAVGPFSLSDSGAFDVDKVVKRAAQRLKGAEVFSADTLHAVGGAWRNLALLHMRMTN